MLRGTPIYTAANIDNKPDVRKDKYVFNGMGLRNDGYKPDLADFAMYEAEVVKFLRTPRSLALFKTGGLYWRIALFVLESSEFDLYQDVVSRLSGPSVDVKFAAVRIELSDSRTSLYDDRLTTDELDLLSGIYRRSNGVYFLLIFLMNMNFS
jgi:hypothetical protein